MTLDGHRHAPAKELSGGQGMLLQIARGFMVHPIRLFLMDEPFAGVHPTIKDTIMETILRMNRTEGVTFLIVSHEMATLRRLCRRVSVMHEGQAHCRGILRRSRQPRRGARSLPGRARRALLELDRVVAGTSTASTS